MMKRNDDKSLKYPSPGTCSPPRLRQRLTIGSKFHEIFNHICALQKNTFEEKKDNNKEQHKSEPDNKASETGSECGQLEIDVVNLSFSNEMPLDSSLLTPDSMLTGQEDTEGYEEQSEEGEEGYEEEELDEGIYDDGIIDEESVYRSLPPGLLSEYELAEMDYGAITGEHRSGFPYYSGIRNVCTRDQTYIANSEIQTLSVNDNGPSTSRGAHEALASLQNTAWIHQPNFQPSTAGGTEPVNTADLFTQPDLKKEYQKLLRQTYYLTKRAK